MSLDADTPLPTPVNTDILVPLDQYKEPILWDENLATIPCILAAVGKYLKRNGLFGPLLEQRAVALSNGKLAVDSVQAVHFVTGLTDDPRGFDDPCPPTPARIDDVNARSAPSPAIKPALTLAWSLG